MTQLESSLHLFQPPLYRVQNQGWVQSFSRASAVVGSSLTWDPAAVLSILSFGYAIGDSTLFNEIKRQPWLSRIDANGQPGLEVIPSHGVAWQSYHKIAENLERLLCAETLQVCQGRKEIYVLLSGGLDSRIIAGIVANLRREGRLLAKPVAVTWGMAASRDVAYAQAVARHLGFEWIHVDLRPEDLLSNIEIAANSTDCLVSPVHLHRMSWFSDVSRDALILAASYGDSVGRAVYSGTHLLELDYLRPSDAYGLMTPNVRQIALESLRNDLAKLHNRSPLQPKYVLCEHEMQGHYMRGMIANIMSIINQYGRVYQMFTHPDVYSYMWSIHPALRSDDVYAVLLDRLDPKLARMPWARNNRALKGKTEGANPDLQKDFHTYGAWISGPLYAELSQLVDPNWFAQTGLFQASAIRELSQAVRRQPENKRLYVPFVWLAAFRKLAERLESQGKNIQLDCAQPSYPAPKQPSTLESRQLRVRPVPRRFPKIYAFVKKQRRYALRAKAVLLYRPRR